VSPDDRRQLRRALLAVEPWLGSTDWGPRAVDAGPCDRCGELPRLLPTCGPAAWPALCRTCASQVGLDAWCDGHQEEARQALAWAAGLPGHWDVAVTAWWVATGEVALESLKSVEGLPAELRRLLP
jgi:hypothetical protein